MMPRCSIHPTLRRSQFLGQRLKAKIKPFLATPEDLNRGFSVYGYELGQDFKKIIEDNVRASLVAARPRMLAEAASASADRRHRG